jgi:NADH-quinone oxidoreductase subunit D
MTTQPDSAATPKRFTIPIGPQHPALKEPGFFEFTVEGETVIGATLRLGYAHRGIEKAVVSRTWVQNLYLLERVCGICSHIHSLAYCLGVEKLAGVTPPPRAQAIRVLIAELERMHSHLLWLGVAAHDAGFETLFMYSWRDRETILDLFEQISGNRVNHSINTLGGVKFDLTAEQIVSVLKAVELMEERARYYLDLVRNDPMLGQRICGIGTMSAAEAHRLGVVGPTARASGVGRDLRVEAPYAAYTAIPVVVMLETDGDLHARFIVRIREMFESCRIIRVLLDHLPEGDLQARMPRRIPEGETIARVEAPRGELFYFIKSNGADMPERIKLRTPTLCNLGSVLALCIGRQLADIPMLLIGTDPCFSCNDRAVVIHQAGNREKWTWEQFRRYGNEALR